MQDGRGQPNPYPLNERLLRIVWNGFYIIIYKNIPRLARGLHPAMLRLFGAKVGKGCTVYPSAEIYFPWKIELKDFSVIGDRVKLYSLGKITVGEHTVISQHSHLCAGTHDYKLKEMPLLRSDIVIGDGCWICTDVFVGPGIVIGNNVVVGARSVVCKNLPDNYVCLGQPCKPVKLRESL